MSPFFRLWLCRDAVKLEEHPRRSYEEIPSPEVLANHVVRSLGFLETRPAELIAREGGNPELQIVRVESPHVAGRAILVNYNGDTVPS